jgi:hypothetical protein
MNNIDYQEKYLKYKSKYLNLKYLNLKYTLSGGSDPVDDFINNIFGIKKNKENNNIHDIHEAHIKRIKEHIEIESETEGFETEGFEKDHH